jgi:uncharacterized protein YndB with AHSA1/START domain
VIRVEIHETVDRPIEEVFERLIDIDAYPDWMPGDGLLVTCRQTSEGPMGEGTEYVDTTRLGTVKGEVVEFERPTRVVFHYVAKVFGRTMMHGWPGYTLEPDGQGGTRVHHVAEGRLQGLFKLLHPLIQRCATAERRRTVDALKMSLEAS